jgi:hypothetical protein
MVQAQNILGKQFLGPQNVFGQPLTIFGLPVDRNTIFMNHKGRYKARIEKRQRRLIAKTTFVNFFLKTNERICCLTTGFTPITVMEQLLTGLAFLFFKRAFFIFTDKRILHIPARIDHFSPSAISQILLEDCAHIEIKGRALVVHYKTGKRETFPYINRRERPRIKSLLKKLTLQPKEAGKLHGRAYLCPSCTQVLEEKVSICSACKLRFKSIFQAKIRALIIPGGGYFYNNYPVFGFAVGILESSLLAAFIYQCSHYLNGAPVNFGVMLLLGCALIIEKIIAAFHSQKLTQDLIPEEKEFAMRKVSPASLHV